MDIWDLMDEVKTELSEYGNGIISIMAACDYDTDKFLADRGVRLDANNPEEMQLAWTLFRIMLDLQDIKKDVDYCFYPVTDVGRLVKDAKGNCSLNGNRIPRLSKIDVLRVSELSDVGILPCNTLEWAEMFYANGKLHDEDGREIEPHTGMFIRIREDKETEC